MSTYSAQAAAWRAYVTAVAEASAAYDAASAAASAAYAAASAPARAACDAAHEAAYAAYEAAVAEARRRQQRQRTGQRPSPAGRCRQAGHQGRGPRGPGQRRERC